MCRLQFIGIYRTRVRTLRFVPLVLPCNAGSVYFSDTALYTPGKRGGVFYIFLSGNCVSIYLNDRTNAVLRLTLLK